jgi:outer membrane usher protein FimD/PapC
VNVSLQGQSSINANINTQQQSNPQTNVNPNLQGQSNINANINTQQQFNPQPNVNVNLQGPNINVNASTQPQQPINKPTTVLFNGS